MNRTYTISATKGRLTAIEESASRKWGLSFSPWGAIRARIRLIERWRSREAKLNRRGDRVLFLISQVLSSAAFPIESGRRESPNHSTAREKEREGIGRGAVTNPNGQKVKYGSNSSRGSVPEWTRHSLIQGMVAGTKERVPPKCNHTSRKLNESRNGSLSLSVCLSS